ncbi:molecular chaperone DjlA [Alloprevotella sp. OH1205_COT-284]|uniref:DnaJ domain-containing protein n=1 Tax=Alloprevotella sp. OH1205_COT-284 TaxID=2491043 RepID=UPI000F5EC5E6|nr:DnaJ domain-containing protein [Alloprevotella sp. OH1205_COT-284]RRD79886.1 molecular chaperone DjlA [Alloprevotella sp. OH1205_COT-284]
MGLGHWIGGALGFVVAPGPLGVIAGAVLGGLVENLFSDKGNEAATRYYDEKAGNPHAYSQQEQRNDFLFSLLVLASYMIQADGRIMHSEMEFVRRFLRSNFGESAVIEGEEILHNLFRLRKKTVDAQGRMAYERLISDSCRQMGAAMSYEQRLQLLALLAEIAKADGRIDAAEAGALREMAVAMGLTAAEAESMLYMGGDSLEDAYKVLETDPDASDEEVRKAYRRLALKHHPDRVAALGEDVRKAAERKFQELGEAKEKIYKARGMK